MEFYLNQSNQFQGNYYVMCPRRVYNRARLAMAFSRCIFGVSKSTCAHGRSLGDSRQRFDSKEFETNEHAQPIPDTMNRDGAARGHINAIRETKKRFDDERTG